MKEIESQRYLRKSAIGDPYLPGNLREQDIPQGIEEDTQSRTGESEVAGYTIEYTYDYDYNNNNANNIKIIKAVLTNPYSLERMGEIYEDKIKNDIEHGEEDAKLERSSDYGAPEYDPMSKYE